MNPQDVELIALVQIVKFAVASAGCGLLLWGAALARAGRPHQHRRLRDLLLATLGLLGALCWTNFFQFHYSHYLQGIDFYHYYVGAKYFPELGYTRLYECTAAADLASGLGDQVADRRLRDLETNTIVTAKAIIADPSRCTRHFSPGRWADFQADVAWFREFLSDESWKQLHLDHGYNATPAWGILGVTIANLGPATGFTLYALSLIDGLLLLVMWGFVWRAFGWRVMCVALVYWGTNYPAHYGWTGGSFLRQDWLAAVVVGICCLRMQRPLAGGFLLAFGAFSRIYPAFALVGLGLKAAWEMARTRSPWISTEHRRLALGALLALAMILPLSALSAGGPSAWRDWAENIQLHLGSPTGNQIGLGTLISYDRETRLARSIDPSNVDPFTVWKNARKRTFERRIVLVWGLVIGFAALLALAVREREDWMAAVLGIGLAVVAMEPSGYYVGVLLCFGFLAQRHPGIGSALCGLAALTLVTSTFAAWPDETFVWMSVEVLGLVVISTAFLATDPRPSPERR